MVEGRIQALQNELDAEAASGADYLPRLQALQRLLQGSVAVQVNSGMLGVCVAFLKPSTGGRHRARSKEFDMEGIESLCAAILKFVQVCKAAIQVHSRIMGQDREDQAFHNELVLGYLNLADRISHFIPSTMAVC
eukprot:SM000002S05483  [mRNA]  locus=s2:44791:46190:+ [translate_table: standard]